MFSHAEVKESGDIYQPFWIVIHDHDWSEPKTFASIGKTYLAVYAALIRAYEHDPSIASNVAKWYYKINYNKNRPINVKYVASYMKEVFPELNYGERFHDAIVNEINKFENLRF